MAAWLLALGAAAQATALADAPATQQARGPSSEPQTNNPLEYDPVTNEHTAKMTLARTAALEFYNAGKYAQAEAKFREAAAEAALGFPPGDPHIASTKNNLAEFLRNTGRWDEAEELYKEALELLDASYGPKHWLYVSALQNLALSYEARGDLAAGIATMERVLGLRLDMFGPRHFLYADSLFALGHMLRKSGKLVEGVKLMNEAACILEEAEKVQANVVLFWLTEIAGCHVADGRPDLAVGPLQRALGHMGSEKGDEAAAASAVNEQLIDVLVGTGRVAEAVAAAESALAARRKMFGDTALVVAQSELRVAQLELLEEHVRQQRPAAAAAAAAVPGPSLPLRALQHAEAASRIATFTADECSRGTLLAGPPSDKVVKRLRAAHTLGSAAKMVATLAGVADPGAAVPTLPAPGSFASGREAAGPASKSSSWWPFGGRAKSDAADAKSKKAPTAEAEAPAGGGSSSSGGVTLSTQLPAPAVTVAELPLADRRLEEAASALAGAAQAGKELMQAVAAGRKQLPAGVSGDEVAGLLVEIALQQLDVLERLGLVLQARVASGQLGAGGSAPGAANSDVVARHRRVLEQQERVAAELLG
ncbi:hypothetical protein HYH02_005850 [Chlamydomonas schloesseri]|uniref:Kinesin light chain n=1 Tax=Chlamydomonas schloesseri TaxID=2026947 RepID=A0A835WKJ2_9CHLO|nr:hypothetical protein HYH02_005850 [Chlamydomonas schloesseri]|eukprot:KAG2449102.1 hypothetical protein HYH02_005850 [Chlamydomonas schloesseri]